VRELEHLDLKHTKWAPDGRSFFTVFHNMPAFRDGRTRDPKVKALMLCDADGGNLRYLGDCGGHPMWSPDGAYIYDYGHHAGKTSILTLDLAGRREVLLHDVPGVHGSISPDGATLVTDVYDTSREPIGVRLLLIDMASRETTELARFDTTDMGRQTGCHAHPVWSRDGRRLYFAANESGRTGVFALDLDR
jgi:Tol biopolymer transport system component